MDATTTGGHRSVTLTDLVRVLVRRWRLVGTGMLIGALAGLGYLALVPPSYTATTEVVLRLPVTNPFSYPGTGADRVINMNVEASLAAGTEVLTAVSEATGDPVGTVRDVLVVEAPVGGQQLRFQYSAGTGELAARGANTAAGAYLTLREEMYAQQRTDRVAAYDESLAETAEDLAAVQEQVEELPAGAGSSQDPRAAAVLAELSSLHTELATIRDERAQIAAVDITPGQITRPARTSPPSTHDRASVLVLAAVLGGGLVGAVVALAGESASRRVRTTADAVETSGLPLLGVVRRRRPGVSAAIARADARYTSLALANRLRAPASGQRRLVLISPRLDPATAALLTRLVAGVAVELAVAGRRVHAVPAPDRSSELRVAVFADAARRTAQESFMEGAAPARLAPREAVAAAAATASPESPRVEGRAGEGRVAVMETRPATGAATIPVGPGSVRIGPEPAGDAEVVVVDAPAAEESPDGVLAARDGTATVVVTCDRTRVPELTRLVDRLRGVGATAIGVIVTRS